jgi:hypothetical protein
MKMSKPIGGLLLLVLLSNSGCSTHAPKSVVSKTPSNSATPDPTGNFATSGVWGFASNKDLIIDGTGRDSFNTLIVRGWGARLTPSVTNPDYGLRSYTNNPVEPLTTVSGKKTPPVPNPGNLWDMNHNAMEAWGTMNTLAKQPAAPVKPP